MHIFTRQTFTLCACSTGVVGLARERFTHAQTLNWSRWAAGFIMAGLNTSQRTEYTCVDKGAVTNGTGTSTGGVPLYPVEMHGSGPLTIPPDYVPLNYHAFYELSCTVCSGQWLASRTMPTAAAAFREDLFTFRKLSVSLLGFRP